MLEVCACNIIHSLIISGIQLIACSMVLCSFIFASSSTVLATWIYILWHVCPCYKWTIESCASAIVDLMIHHCFYLQLSSYDLECASLLPAEFSLPFSSGNQESKITSILKQELGILAVEGICSKSHCQWHVQKNQHHAAKMQKVENNYLPTQSIIVVLDLLITAKVTFVNNKRFVVSVV